ncbi:MAG: GGDEF domain-containing protein [Deferribacteraceae bacterium]|jgi:diguanylate cyclase (GGDEF)-like protein|nr:GGDEF domain-containing protein [Deferribacteraceae bacterium]
MDIIELVTAFFTTDARTLLSVLFLGNFVTAMVIVVYRVTVLDDVDLRRTTYYIIAKLVQGIGYFCLFSRGALPEIMSVNIGNTFLIASFGFEAVATMVIVHEQNKKIYVIELALVLIAILGFNITEFILPDPAVRVVTASAGVCLVLLVPTAVQLFAKKKTIFMRLAGVFYASLIVLMALRGINAMEGETSVHANVYIQTLTFTMLVVLMLASSSGYLLLMKENADRAISKLASTDGLTGITNRRSFLVAAEIIFTSHQSLQEPISILFFDIDNFKKVNDSYGHAFGDKVLIALAEVLKTSLRTQDISCRYGGEEFVVLLAYSNIDSTKKVCERLVERISEIRFPEMPDFRFTVSCGVANGVPNLEDGLMMYIDNADKGLYSAKNTGKNRTVYFYNNRLTSTPI